MSVLIKGMKMPTSCASCRFDNGIFCKAYPHSSNFIYDIKIGIPEWCPLVEVPPHGRLIDADSLKEAYCANCFADENPMECEEPCMDIKILLEAPTIIEA